MNTETESNPQDGAVQTVPVNRYLRHDGTDASAAFRAGLEISGICVVGIAIILTLYYAGLRVLVALFPPKQTSEPTANDD
jgi:hypothetical protein